MGSREEAGTGMEEETANDLDRTQELQIAE
jgi:hypothetical protein